MHLIAPEILAEARGLSTAASAIGLGLGLLLWLLGWWGHRFWIVVATTVVAGIIGLHTSRFHGVQPLVVALLLSLAAGMLALALVRVLAFVAGGVAVCLAVRAFFPAWEQPFLCFLAGGLAGLLLFRLWTMALTSFTGTLLMVYSALCLADRLGKLDAIAWSEHRVVWLNGICIGLTLTGLVTQFAIERYRATLHQRRKKAALACLSEDEREQLKEYRLRKKSWLGKWGWTKKGSPLRAA